MRLRRQSEDRADMRSLLGEMKHHSVQPYVIWDRKGVREWKGPEVRALQYAPGGSC